MERTKQHCLSCPEEGWFSSLQPERLLKKALHNNPSSILVSP